MKDTTQNNELWKAHTKEMYKPLPCSGCLDCFSVISLSLWLGALVVFRVWKGWLYFLRFGFAFWGIRLSEIPGYVKTPLSGLHWTHWRKAADELTEQKVSSWWARIWFRPFASCPSQRCGLEELAKNSPMASLADCLCLLSREILIIFLWFCSLQSSEDNFEKKEQHCALQNK